jgi:hypothetical protein
MLFRDWPRKQAEKMPASENHSTCWDAQKTREVQGKTQHSFFVQIPDFKRLAAQSTLYWRVSLCASLKADATFSNRSKKMRARAGLSGLFSHPPFFNPLSGNALHKIFGVTRKSELN